MARRRTTYGKLQRDREKQARAQAKVVRRHAKAEKSSTAEEEPTAEVDQEKILSDLAALHEAYDAGDMSFEYFEARKEELTSSLRIQ